ncbi:diphthine--ammonia ligase [Bacillus suaedaesalsae]|uniref:Diphthine--ammonia ligase n=1 Tax=Bacillus suaedaesalsae TaxID=2810349 RepID=A0ABS2DEK1_9BACI|nr:diphthine--ammonia ligase [Bacillus suaedaesalsae]MBM6616897.1 diphthine--ammonia ligase [Bacillus suaedaesalsae]
MKEKIAVSWSGGKDSTFALYILLQSDQYMVDSLFTTITEDVNRISIHGVRESLLEKQAESLGFPLRKMYIPKECSNEIYNERLVEQLRELKKEEIHTVMFGDIFLKDVRKYREQLVSAQGMKAVFPLWGFNTEKLVSEFWAIGFKTITTCIDTEILSTNFLGRIIDLNFIHELPTEADPCGENGEFHTFAFDGPIFTNKITFNLGEYIDEGRFHFVDLVF